MTRARVIGLSALRVIALNACGTARHKVGVIATDAASRRALGPVAQIKPGVGIGQVRIGERRAALDRALGKGRPGAGSSKPPVRTYGDPKTGFLVVFSAGRVSQVSSGSTRLTILG